MSSPKKCFLVILISSATVSSRNGGQAGLPARALAFGGQAGLPARALAVVGQEVGRAGIFHKVFYIASRGIYGLILGLGNEPKSIASR